jgi:hypothetical protein
MEKKLKSPVVKEAAAPKAETTKEVKAPKVPKVPKVPKAPKVAGAGSPVGRRKPGMRTAEEIILDLCTQAGGATMQECGDQITKEWNEPQKAQSHLVTARTYLTDSLNYNYFGGRLATKYGLKSEKNADTGKFFFRTVTEAEVADCNAVREAHKVAVKAKKAVAKEVVAEMKAEAKGEAPVEAPAAEAPAAEVAAAE